MVLALMLALLLAHHWRVNRLLQKRKLAIKAEERPRSHAAEALRESREKLALVERAGMTSHLAAMFAHEIKQPLTSIVNYLTGIRLMMKLCHFDEAKWSEVLSAAEQETHRAACIIERVRDVLRKDAPDMRPVNVKNLVNEAVKHAGRVLGYADLRINLPDDDVHVSGEVLELELVLVNFLNNAA